jgi:hypothetical protein
MERKLQLRNSLQLCGQKQHQIKIYPTITRVILSSLVPIRKTKQLVEVVDAGGRKIMVKQVLLLMVRKHYFDKRPASDLFCCNKKRRNWKFCTLKRSQQVTDATLFFVI